MLQQGFYFEGILTFHDDELRGSSGRAFRDMPLQLRHMEDIVDVFEPALDVKSIGCLSYTLQHPEWSHKSSSELPSTSKAKGFREEQHLFSKQMLLQLVMLVKIALLVVLCSLQVILGVLTNLLDVLSKVNCIRHLPMVAHNDINQKSILFHTQQFKWRAAYALSYS